MCIPMNWQPSKTRSNPDPKPKFLRKNPFQKEKEKLKNFNNFKFHRKDENFIDKVKKDNLLAQR